MTTGQKIARLRRERGITQGRARGRGGRHAAGGLQMGIGRQALPDADKLGPPFRTVRLHRRLSSEKQGGRPRRACGAGGTDGAGGAAACGEPPVFSFRAYEYKSRRTLFGLPLVHINIGIGSSAKGILAVGFKARGVLSFGIFSAGGISFGVLSAGLVSAGAASLGIVALGALSLGIFLALGAVAVGFLAYGAVAVGFFSAGALAVARYVAVGDYAFAAVPVARTYASGGELYNFYFLYTAAPPAAQAGVYEGGQLVPAGSAFRGSRQLRSALLAGHRADVLFLSPVLNPLSRREARRASLFL